MGVFVNAEGRVFDLNQKAEHPEGKIELLDGSVIDGYPLEQKKEEVDNEFALDTTGEYLQLHRHKTVPEQREEAAARRKRREEVEELFLKNAFYLWAHSEDILSDSRMFLTPIPVQSGLAYTGTSGFNNPTLGVYIEWWLTCMSSRVIKEDGSYELVWFLSGSPLSGANCSSAVNEKGETRTTPLSPFRDAWQPFVAVNRRYDRCKEKYQAYTLEEVLDILHGRPENEKECQLFQLRRKEECQLFLLRRRVECLHHLLDKKKGELHRLSGEHGSLWNKFCRLMVMHNYKKVKKFYDDYHEQERICEERVREQSQRRREAIARKDEYSATDFQNVMTSVKQQKSKLREDLRKFKEDGLHEVFPDDDVPYWKMEKIVSEIESEVKEESDSETLAED